MLKGKELMQIKFSHLQLTLIRQHLNLFPCKPFSLFLNREGDYSIPTLIIAMRNQHGFHKHKQSLCCLGWCELWAIFTKKPCSSHCHIDLIICIIFVQSSIYSKRLKAICPLDQHVTIGRFGVTSYRFKNFTRSSWELKQDLYFKWHGSSGWFWALQI